MGTEGQECGGREVSESTHSMLGIGDDGFLKRGKQGQGRKGGGVRVLEFGGLFPNRDRGGDRDQRGRDRNWGEGGHGTGDEGRGEQKGWGIGHKHYCMTRISVPLTKL